MRSAFFALPAIAFGLMAVWDARIGLALLFAWVVGVGTAWFRRPRRRVDHSADEVASGLVSKDVGATVQLLLDALPKAGMRWVRVAKTSPPRVRAGTAKPEDTAGVEIEVELSPVSASATRVTIVGRPISRPAGIVTTECRGIVDALAQSIGFELAGGTT